MKKQEILDGDWDYLIILDACRYDDFKEKYKEYFTGNLEARRSRGSCTAEWLHETFDESLPDTVYISANPYINSQNVPLKKLYLPCRSGWYANPYFKKVIDGWDFCWNEELSTVHPDDLGRFAMEKLNEERTIIHYMQPHRPYITAGIDEGSSLGRNKIKGQIGGNKLISITKLFMPVWNKFNTCQRAKIKKYLGLKNTFWQKACLEMKTEKLREYYRKNLNIVLESLAKLLEKLEGKVVITSDHGEAFGENNEFGHPPKTHIPTLVEVPWFEVESVVKDYGSEIKGEEVSREEISKDKKDEIRKKLKSLGYQT